MLRTPWGYKVDADELPSLISAEQYALLAGITLTAETTPRVTATLAAVSAAVRGYCGWHIAPVVRCQSRVTGEGRMLRLPTLALLSVDAIEIDGDAVDIDGVEHLDSGLVRVSCGRWPHAWGGVVVDYTSGLDVALAPDLAAVVAQVASNAMAGAPGVASERAGEVSITYNLTAYGVAGGVTLLDRDKALLAPYRLPPIPR